MSLLIEETSYHPHAYHLKAKKNCTLHLERHVIIQHFFMSLEYCALGSNSKEGPKEI